VLFNGLCAIGELKSAADEEPLGDCRARRLGRPKRADAQRQPMLERCGHGSGITADVRLTAIAGQAPMRLKPGRKRKPLDA
jgi:hypothetical protein